MTSDSVEVTCSHCGQSLGAVPHLDVAGALFQEHVLTCPALVEPEGWAEFAGYDPAVESVHAAHPMPRQQS
jgi:hypothetical protein